MVALAWLLGALARGDVFDRYLVVAMILLPIVWVRSLPRWLILLQGIGLFALLIIKVSRWLM